MCEKFKLSSKTSGCMAIAGHSGCGHCHSLNNQIQDDSAGLAVVLSIFKEATGLSLKLKNISVSGNTITAIMDNGGIGKAFALRPITPQEKNIIKRLIGKEIINTHSLILDLFGRFYGQGISETPVAVQTAIANAALNGFYVNYPENFSECIETVKNNCGEIVGTVIDYCGIPVSVLGTVNATNGGIGPNEDLEGNSNFYSKQNIIKKLNMDTIPTLVIEAMIFSSLSDSILENTFFVRADNKDDNPFVAEAVSNACLSLNYPLRHISDNMKRQKDTLRHNTYLIGQKICDIGKKLSLAETSAEKVQIISELAILVSQDCGGISFMSNSIHELLGGSGMLPTTSAVLNLVVSENYIKQNPMPFLTHKELDQYIEICRKTILNLYNNLDNARKHIKKDYSSYIS